jgi:DNA-binding NarL/FixJ family response regulator
VRIFLVEDSPLLRERLQALLGAIPGIACIGHAGGAAQAVAAIVAARPDVVVLDIHLSQGNGFDVLRGLRAAAFEPVVFVLTNYPLESYRKTAERLGARGFFDKSHEIELLRDEIGKLLRP